MPAITKPQIAPEVFTELEHKLEEERQVIVHCCYENDFFLDSIIRIWPSTYLIDAHSGARSQLLFWDNISAFPYWTKVPPLQDYRFTLIFSGLPKNCTVFDFVEEIPEDGGFLVKGIRRNSSDVYTIKL